MIFVERIAPDGTPHRITIRSHELITDMGLGNGGSDIGPDSHDLYDSALGACVGLTMVWYARRKDIALENVHVGIQRDNSREDEGLYRLIVRVAIDGDLTDAQHAKLIEVAGKCPIHRLMTDVRTEIETIAVAMPPES